METQSPLRVLERRTTLLMVGALFALAAAAWWNTVGAAHEMSGMVDGVAQVGNAMRFEMAAPIFIAMWTTMMVAMMFPTIAPIVLLHRMVTRKRGEGIAASTAFASGYLFVWAATGVIPLVALIAFRHVATAGPWVSRAGGGVLVVAGLYQFTGWKQSCLKACRTPLTFLMTHKFGKGLTAAFRVGASHGMYCLGCCWALMTVLFVVGLMNLVWMAAIAAIFLAEKNWRHGVGLIRVVGTIITLLGLTILMNPSVLRALAPVSQAMH